MNIPSIFASMLSGRGILGRRKRQPICKAPRRSRLRLELLEDRCTPATFSVLDSFSGAISAGVPGGNAFTGIAAPPDATGIDTTLQTGTDPNFVGTADSAQAADSRTVDLHLTAGTAVQSWVFTEPTAPPGTLHFSSPNLSSTGTMTLSYTLSGTLLTNLDPDGAGPLSAGQIGFFYSSDAATNGTQVQLKINGNVVAPDQALVGNAPDTGPLAYQTFVAWDASAYEGVKITSIEFVFAPTGAADFDIDKIVGSFSTVDAAIKIEPQDATNPVGTNHTLTATVSQDDGLAAGAPGDAVTGYGPAPAGTVVSFTLTNTGGATAVFVDDGVNSTTDHDLPNPGMDPAIDAYNRGNDALVTGLLGQAQVTITSPTAGDTTINAYTTFSVSGIELTRDTDPATLDPSGPVDPAGDPALGSGPAIKHWTEIPVTGVTRTQGFWATHTAFTTSIFENELGGSITIGSPGDQYFIVVDTTQELFGGFCASIPKLSDGHTKRSDVGQARMILLQQLLAAELNCGAFGCDQATKDLIDKAEAAFANGSSTRDDLITLAGQLDTYNNSGDTGAIPAGLGSPGKATPKDSAALCTKGSSWDFVV